MIHLSSSITLQSNTQILFSIQSPPEYVQYIENDLDSFTGSYLFDTVRVNCGLWLQYADRFWFLGTLGHLADLLCNEVVHTIEGFDGTLYETYSFSCSCDERGRK